MVIYAPKQKKMKFQPAVIMGLQSSPDKRNNIIPKINNSSMSNPCSPRDKNRSNDDLENQI